MKQIITLVLCFIATFAMAQSPGDLRIPIYDNPATTLTNTVVPAESYGLSVLNTTNAAALRTLAGVVIGTDVQAYNANTTILGSSIDLTSEITGILPVANGGINISSYTIGDILYASGTTTISKLADVATGSVLVSGGVGVAPFYSSTPTFAATNLTGTASGLTAGNVTTNANLTGAITSIGNATSLNSFTKSSLNTAVSDDDPAYVGTAQTFTAQNTFAQGTITTSKPFHVSQTWNDGAVSYSGMKLAITDISSSISEEYFGIYGGAAGTTKMFSVEKVGGANLVSLGKIVSTSNTFSIDNDVSGISLGSARQISWSSTVASYDTADLFLRRDAAATLQLGTDAATATTQTIKGADGSGTDKAGFSFVSAGGQSTGTAAGGDVISKTSLTGSTGSSLNSYSTRSYTRAKPVDLTESTATLFANIALASSKYVGVKIVATVNAGDGTDFQSLTSELKIDAVNKAGTVTVTPPVQNDGTTAASTGTLTATYTAVANGASFDIKCNAVSSLTQTMLRVKYVIQTINSDDVATVTP